MSFAVNKELFGLTLLALLVIGYTSNASAIQVMDQGNVSPQPDNTPAEGSGYFSQHFSEAELTSDIKMAIIHANLTPVSFNKVTVHTRDQLTTKEQSKPAAYTVTVVMENAGHGLIRRMESAQGHDGNTVVRFDLTYRGYLPFLTQSVPANANSLPPMIETRKVMRFDTNTEGHMNFTYLYGATGQPTFPDPGQVICDSGKRYSASELNPAIEGQALELKCQMVDTNGMVTDKITFAYLEKYDVALMVRVQNPENMLDRSIVDFKVQ